MTDTKPTTLYTALLAAQYKVHPIVDESTGCHFWPGATDMRGYGKMSRNGRTVSAHRWYWIQAKGPIPEGLQLDHLCRNRRCCNPEHLELVTNRENQLRGNHPNMVAHRENRCRRGHEMTPENTYRSRRGRQCRTCALAGAKRRYDQQKDVAA